MTGGEGVKPDVSPAARTAAQTRQRTLPSVGVDALGREELGVAGLGTRLGDVLLDRQLQQHLGDNLAAGLQRLVWPDICGRMQCRPERLKCSASSSRPPNVQKHSGPLRIPTALRGLPPLPTILCMPPSRRPASCT